LPKAKYGYRFLPVTSENPDDTAHRNAFDQAWAILKPELACFSAPEIVAIRGLLVGAIIEASAQGERDSTSLCVLAFQKLYDRLRLNQRSEASRAAPVVAEWGRLG
jgi:hypothetical protein